MATHILLIESNNLAKSESLSSSLGQQGYHVCVAHTPSIAVENINASWPDLIVFDLLNIKSDPSSYHEAINATDLNVPYLIVGEDKNLSVETDVDIVNSGRDSKELQQQIKKIVSKQADRFIRYPDLTIDCEQYQVQRDGQSYSLTPKEFKLLHLLVSNADQVSSRKAIMQEVWETNYLGDTRTLDVHIRWLREKIEQNPSRPRHLITVRGVGYHFVTEPDQSSA